MSGKIGFFIIYIVGIVLAFVCFAGNQTELNLQIASFNTSASAASALIGSYIIGSLVGVAAMYMFISGKADKDIAKLKDWQKQDQKLLKEVQSDKEKQLEAKIATLETALKQALKK
ncbi:MAG: hypothetical protein K2W82_13215 [Candidatus Obscuribacterales bacterium]|jgi:uncharacterized integral membrane protein|nr:hypothetical protein [Candidatus Obscuribacterales bacterium]